MKKKQFMNGSVKSINITQIIGQLNDLSIKSEDIFLKLARSLPALFREIEGGVNKANNLIELFSRKSTPGDLEEQDNLIINSIDKVEFLVENASDFFVALESRDSKLVAAISSSIDCLASLESQFTDIKEDSIDMEIVSLNAKVAAIKAGKHSVGFAYISDELRKLSTVSANSTDRLTNSGGDVLKNLTHFTGKIEKIQNIQQSFYNHFRENLKYIFTNYNQKVEGLIEHLTSAISEAESVKGPLNNIMEIIQLQDIIRQSLEHVELVLKESDKNTVSGSPRQMLDELTFIETLYKLCSDLLEGIGENLTESFTIFSTNIADLRAILDKVDKDSECIKTPPDQLSHIVSNSVESLESLLENLDKSMQEKSSIPLDAEQIIQTLKQLEDSFMTSLSIVSRFYPININARMETAKWDILNQFGVATKEMSSATDKINRDMGTALQLIRKIKKEIETSITLYAKGNAEEITAVNNITGRIKECYDELAKSSIMLSDTLHSFSVYSNSFFTLLDNTELDIAELNKLNDVINNIRRTLFDSGQVVTNRKTNALYEIGMEKWEVKDSKLEDIINKFTIYTHKQTAENIAGIKIVNRVEAGEAGELTLF